MRIALVVSLAGAIGLLAAIAFSSSNLIANQAGRWLLLFSVALAPLTLIGAGVTVGVHESSRTSFCMSCHEMDAYGQSLFVDNPQALSAVHYQKRLIDRDSTCFSCHTDYAMFGDEKAKLNGLRHVWVHYFGTAPAKIALYQPYPNHNCLHCHDDARNYLEKAPHLANRAALQSGSLSCLSCHAVFHDLAGVTAGHFWVAP